MKNGIIKNLFEVALSNLITLLAGVLVGFLLPKIISIDDYGYFKTFTLYCSYIGLFSIGIIDGIVLTYGGKNYDQLDKLIFRSYFSWYVFVHLIIALIILFISLMFLDGDLQFILISICVFMIANNITGYFQQISQITQRYREYSARKIIQSVLNVIILTALFVLYRNGYEVIYKMYLVLWITINVFLTIWYIYTYRDIVFGKRTAFWQTRSDIKGLIQCGVPLLISNLCATLILTLDRQFVNILFDNHSYAIYAFAYNMLSLVTVATSAISTVLYPTMKRYNEEKLKKNYSYLVAIVLVFVFFTISLYFPLSSFVKWFLPKYNESIRIFRIIFPGLAISTAVTVVMHNYYKVLGYNINYFRKSLIALIISGLANAISYYLFRTTIAISIASILCMVFWYIYVERLLIKDLLCKWKCNMLYMLLMLSFFYVVSSINNAIIGFFIYVLTFMIFTKLMFKDFFNVKALKSMLKN